jgi:hypothetical protein
MKGEFQNFSQYYQIFPPMRSLLDNSYTEDEVCWFIFGWKFHSLGF